MPWSESIEHERPGTRRTGYHGRSRGREERPARKDSLIYSFGNLEKFKILSLFISSPSYWLNSRSPRPQFQEQQVFTPGTDLELFLRPWVTTHPKMTEVNPGVILKKSRLNIRDPILVAIIIVEDFELGRHLEPHFLYTSIAGSKSRSIPGIYPYLTTL